MSDTPLEQAQRAIVNVERIGKEALAEPTKWRAAGGADVYQSKLLEYATAHALVSIAESLDRLVGIPPCPHCGSRAGATAWDAVEVVDDDPTSWHRRCAACGGRLPELEP